MSSDESLSGSDVSDAEPRVDQSGSNSSIELCSENTSNSDESVNIVNIRKWYELQSNAPAPPYFPFTAVPAINFATTDWNILQFFEHFVDDDLIDHIVEETNQYADQKNRSIWHPMTSAELRVFLGLIILQSVVKKPEIRQYWSKNPLLVTPFFPKCISNKRFEEINQNLYFYNNEDFDAATHPNPKLHKIWPIYEKLSTKFRDAITPERHITIDESLLLYKGRLGWIKLDIPLKRARFGIKTYLLCESKSGYV